MSTFEAWPKIPRWNREVVVTEKIDGTNAAIIIEDRGDEIHPTVLAAFTMPDEQGNDGFYAVYAQSRTRLLTLEADNFGFARWVQENARPLVKLLGGGRHFGEWYGRGIQRGYNLDHRRFALFNTSRWGGEQMCIDPDHPEQISLDLPVDVVPVLGTTPAPCPVMAEEYVRKLRNEGSAMVPGYMKPEGIVLWHTAARQAFKVLVEGDECPKGTTSPCERELAAT